MIAVKSHFSLLALIVVVMFSSVATLSAATYYVSSTSGNDSNTGLDAAHTWAHCPGMVGWTGNKTLVAGDSVLFNKGDTWIAPAGGGSFIHITGSGTSGNPITYGSYGSGNMPKINGNDVHYAPSLIAIGASWVTIDGWEIYDVHWEAIHIAPPSTGVVIQNCSIHDNNVVGYMLVMVDGGGVSGQTTQFTIQGCRIYNALHNCIRVSGGVTYATIANNVMYHAYHHAIDTYADTVVSSHFSIHGNDVYDTKGQIYADGLADSEIYDNDVHDDWPGAPDLADGYGPSATGIVVGAASGLPSSNLLIHNNRIWNISTADANTFGCWDDHSVGDNWWNNTIYHCYKTFMSDGTSTNLGVKNSLAYANTTDSVLLRNYGLNPLFVNTTATPPDFHLQAGSSAINAGTNLGLPYVGSAPDLGAYEYVSATQPPQPPSGLRLLP